MSLLEPLGEEAWLNLEERYAREHHGDEEDFGQTFGRLGTREWRYRGTPFTINIDRRPTGSQSAPYQVTIEQVGVRQGSPNAYVLFDALGKGSDLPISGTSSIYTISSVGGYPKVAFEEQAVELAKEIVRSGKSHMITQIWARDFLKGGLQVSVAAGDVVAGFYTLKLIDIVGRAAGAGGGLRGTMRQLALSASEYYSAGVPRARFPGMVRAPIGILDPVQLNRAFTQPPWQIGTEVYEFRTSTPIRFVRVFTASPSARAQGRWLMPAGEISGLTREQIQFKLALPRVPTHIVEVTVPEGTLLRMGTAGGNAWAVHGGGGTQIQLMEDIPVSAWSGPRKLP